MVREWLGWLANLAGRSVILGKPGATTAGVRRHQHCTASAVKLQNQLLLVRYRV